MKKMIFLCVALVLVFGLFSTANATPVAGLFNSAPTNTLLSDNSGDLFIDVNVNNIVDAGDILVTIVGINTIGATTVGSGTVYNEVTAISAAKIVGPVIPLGPNGQGVQMELVVSEMPVTAADAPYFDWATGTILGGLYTFTTQPGLSNDGNQFALVYEDASQDYTRSSTIQNGFNSATNGDWRLTIGIGGAGFPVDYIQSIGPVSPLTDPAYLALPGATAVSLSSLAFGGEIIAQNWPGLLLNNRITGGNGGFSTPEAGSGWPVYNNLDFTVTAVPEPATFALMGIGLLGAGLLSRIRRRD